MEEYKFLKLLYESAKIPEGSCLCITFNSESDKYESSDGYSETNDSDENDNLHKKLLKDSYEDQCICIFICIFSMVLLYGIIILCIVVFV